jgi:uncharacterized protein
MAAGSLWWALDLDGQVGPQEDCADHFDPRRYQVTHPNELLMREGFEVFSRGDMDALSQYWAEDIRWHTPGRGVLAGDYEGIAQVLESVFGRIAELSEGTFRAELHDVLANDEHVVALFTGRAERAGKHWQDNFVQVFHFRDGKVTEVWNQFTDLYALDEFWS